MTVPDNVRADILAQALPYMRRFAGKTLVVKYGGAAMTNEGVKITVVQDLVALSCVGIRIVLVHGGGPEIDSMLRRLGKEPTFVQGLRYTDEETMDVVQMVLAGKVNKDIVALIQRQGGRALGLCGADGGLIAARRRSKGGVDLGLVGEIESIDRGVLDAALAGGYIPVVATVGMGGTDDERLYNINADTAAADIAVALGAEKLVLLTDVPGVLRDPEDASTLVSALPRTLIEEYLEAGIVSKGMIPKIECCARAVDGGVGRAHIVDGRSPHALLLELFTDRGVGTMIL
ncbi:MAG TPA: acetylglutamate kinase [Rectinemataceae bacterium]|nr:acetylglutamate kinase [Rectinemataceae bacterium]